MLVKVDVLTEKEQRRAVVWLCEILEVGKVECEGGRVLEFW